jgi:nitrous oxidase accessory protein NosD
MNAPYAQPLAPAQHWVLATAAILNKRDDRRLDVLGGAPRPVGSWKAFFLLMKSWGVETATDALDRLTWLCDEGHRGSYEARGAGPAQAFVGWDACRAAHVAGWAYVAYLLDKPTAWKWMLRASEMLRGAYRSWAEVGQSYVRGLDVWSDGDREMVDPTAQAVAWLSSDPSSPWVALPWGMDLSAATVPPDPWAQEVRVGPHGPARTIGDGVRMAGPGGRVIVSAGQYRETVQPEHPVEIVADGQVLLEGAGEPCVRVTDERTVVLRGLTLRADRTPKGNTLNAVHSVRGFPRLESCDVSATNDGVQLRDWAICHVVDSRIHGCGQMGLNALGGHFVVVRTEIAQAAKDAVRLKAKGPSTLEQCRIVGAGEAGIAVHDDVAATVRDVELVGCGAPAAIVGAGSSSLTLERVKVTEGRGGGVFFQDTSGGSLEDVTVTGTTLAALDVGTSEVVVVDDLKLARNQSSGILVRAQGRLLLQGSNLDASQEGHVWIMTGGRAAFTKCRVAGGKLGLWVQGGATAHVHRTVFEGQLGPGVDAQQGARVMLSKCKVIGAGGDGVVAGPGSSVRLSFSEVGPVEGAGVRALDGADVSIEDSVLEGARGGDLVGRGRVVASKVAGQLGGEPGRGTPEERRKSEDALYEDAAGWVANGD